eukprot:gnl/TRDRNA2_/TRDRNA2_158275_c5_seq1.p1 gnl/TRDRNA2_/TRDRNA2_158275_c5~~gnl/TRDRNA2_/TRDRNA2_158275_c5_seq1.p1  ORF type:complete len:555 (+),score=120.86 gnl/TRDRNA2_/TRDRNA2_158275_c5_seq1:205-1665(+)
MKIAEEDEEAKVYEARAARVHDLRRDLSDQHRLAQSELAELKGLSDEWAHTRTSSAEFAAHMLQLEERSSQVTELREEVAIWKDYARAQAAESERLLQSYKEATQQLAWAKVQNERLQNVTVRTAVDKLHHREVKLPSQNNQPAQLEPADGRLDACQQQAGTLPQPSELSPVSRSASKVKAPGPEHEAQSPTEMQWDAYQQADGSVVTLGYIHVAPGSKATRRPSKEAASSPTSASSVSGGSRVRIYTDVQADGAEGHEPLLSDPPGAEQTVLAHNSSASTSVESSATASLRDPEERGSVVIVPPDKTAEWVQDAVFRSSDDLVYSRRSSLADADEVSQKSSASRPSTMHGRASHDESDANVHAEVPREDAQLDGKHEKNPPEACVFLEHRRPPSPPMVDNGMTALPNVDGLYSTTTLSMGDGSASTVDIREVMQRSDGGRWSTGGLFGMNSGEMAESMAQKARRRATDPSVYGQMNDGSSRCRPQ